MPDCIYPYYDNDGFFSVGITDFLCGPKLLTR